MGAYLSSPVTEKESYSGSNKFLEYGGASMQGWRKSMEDAHIAVLDLGNKADMAMFGVFDGHGGSEVAKFCQKYMADEITKLEHYHQGRLSDCLVEVFHRIDLMLRDDAYSNELATLKRPRQELAGPDDKLENNEQGQGQVSTADAMVLLRRVLALRRQAGADAATIDAKAALEANPSSSSPLPQQADPAIEAVNTPEAGPALGTGADAGVPDAQIQAGCTAVVAVFQGDQLYIANAGDSRAVLCRGPDAVALSEDHKPASEAEKARIMAAGGFISDVGGVIRVNGNLNLSRAIGDLRYKGNELLAAADQIISAQPDVTQITLSSSDWFLVLACDGVWDVMSNQEVVNFVGRRLSQGEAPADIAGQLLDACLANDPTETRGIGCDNMTATIIVMRQNQPTLVQSKSQ